MTSDINELRYRAGVFDQLRKAAEELPEVERLERVRQDRGQRKAQRDQAEPRMRAAIAEVREKQRAIPPLVEKALSAIQALAAGVQEFEACSARQQADWWATKLSLLDFEDALEKAVAEQQSKGWAVDEAAMARGYGKAYSHDLLVRAGLPAPWLGVHQTPVTVALEKTVRALLLEGASSATPHRNSSELPT